MGKWFSKNTENAVDETEVIQIKNSNNNIIDIHTEHLNAIKQIKLYLEIAFGLILIVVTIFIARKLFKAYQKRAAARKEKKLRNLKRMLSTEMLNEA